MALASGSHGLADVRLRQSALHSELSPSRRKKETTGLAVIKTALILGLGVSFINVAYVCCLLRFSFPPTFKE